MKNNQTIQNFLNLCGKPVINGNLKHGLGNYRNSYQWKNITSNKIIDLLKNFKYQISEKSFVSIDLIDYIKKVNKLGELEKFTVTLFGNGKGKEEKLFNKFKINNIIRQERGKNLKDTIQLHVVTTDKLVGVDLPDEGVKELKKRFTHHEKTKKSPEDIFSWRHNIRDIRSAKLGSLNIYPITAVQYNNKDEKKIISEQNLITLSIDFPETEEDRSKTTIKHRVNTIFAREQRLSLN